MDSTKQISIVEMWNKPQKEENITVAPFTNMV